LIELIGKLIFFSYYFILILFYSSSGGGYSPVPNSTEEGFSGFWIGVSVVVSAVSSGITVESEG
jgi:hypothetical protein